MNSKIAKHHRNKPAYLYLRQSTPGQVRYHQESTERQYALREKALELGRSPSLIGTLDRDLDKTGTEMACREDFKTWWRMSRWARWGRYLPWKSRDCSIHT
jgi:hypothetical protein